MVILPASAATEAALHALETEAGHGFAGSCIVVEVGETITPAEDTCYELHFDSTSDDSTFTIDASGAANVAIFAQHFPTEFERDTHYLQDASGTDIEPAAEEGAGDGHAHGHDHGSGQASCGCESQEADHPFAINCTDVATIRSAGQTLLACNGGVPAASACEDAVATDPTCQIAFFVIQAHHDHCPHDTLVRRRSRSHQRTASLACTWLAWRMADVWRGCGARCLRARTTDHRRGVAVPRLGELLLGMRHHAPVRPGAVRVPRHRLLEHDGCRDEPRHPRRGVHRWRRVLL